MFLHETYHYPRGYSALVRRKTTGQDLVAAGLASVEVLERGTTVAGDWLVLAVATTAAAAPSSGLAGSDANDVVLSIERTAS